MTEQVVKKEVFPGFKQVTPQIFYQEADANAVPVPDSGIPPRAIILFGWGDCLPKHLSKYTSGLRTLYPTSTIVAVLAPILRVLTTKLATRASDMAPIIDLVYPQDAKYTPTSPENAVLIHAMSNTGALNYTALIHEFRERRGKPMPATLLSHDSMPGTAELTMANFPRWSRAMALGTASAFPWPFFVTQAIWGVFLVVHEGVYFAMGQDTPPRHALKLAVNKGYIDEQLTKLYMYSKEDEIIYWEDVENAMASSKAAGYEVVGKVFEGTGHVGHMRAFPEEYWGLLSKTWTEAAKRAGL